MRIMRSGLALAGILINSSCFGASSPRRVVVAESLSTSAVQKAIDAAKDGDAVRLPAGNATWNTGVTVSGKYLTLEGAGIDKTMIVGGDYAPSAVQPTHRVFTLDAKPGGLTRLTGLTIDGGSGAKDDYNKGMIAISGNSTTWRIDHLRICATRTCAMHVYASGGVIDHCRFELVGWIFGIYGFNGGGSYGDKAWAEDIDLGEPKKAFFVEDNVFIATDQSFALDGWSGMRVAFRHNALHNAVIGDHGTESSGRLRGARGFEIYDNAIALSGRTFYGAIELRSGTGVIFNNKITGDVTEALRADNYRDFDAFAPWGIASGESPFDLNDLDPSGAPKVCETGESAGANEAKSLECPGKTWTPNQWRGYSVFNVRTGKSAIIVSNARDEIMTRYDDTHGGPNLLWSAGDRFRIERCRAALDQMGRGKGSLIAGDDPSPRKWPEQASEPVYVWNNTLNGVKKGLVSASPHIKEGVDFYNNRPKPGYVPYAYPHPLTKR